MKSYIITLDEDFKDKKVYKTLLSAGIIPEISPGIRASEEDLKKWPFCPKSSLGCYLAHRNVWQKISDSDSCALILEDDVEPLFIDSSEIDNLTIPYNGILKLHSEHQGERAKIDSNAAYIMTNSAAKQLLNDFKVILNHVDWDMYYNCLRHKIEIKQPKTICL